ncbi:hypothetical protein HanPSC8_Chr09g0367031 [Helianthus annuus]|nr:hypothetical protein HanPSC8_Chr09g0367031 [Helianthus annuus]
MGLRYVRYGMPEDDQTEEPNTIKTHASAHCLVVNFNDEPNHVHRITYEL